MKTFIALGLSLLWIVSLNGQEISISTPALVRITEQITHHVDSETKKPFDVKWQIHHFVAFLKNESGETLKVVTGQLDTSGSVSQRNRTVTATTAPPLFRGESQVIPATEELRLVEIRPGESAAMEFVIKSNGPVESLAVTYAPKDHFAGRFGFWTGTVTSEAWRAPVQTEKR
ncbi:MAG: hypothetical protein BGO12_21365 [Verrucomicrobia bacterium 61-8]|nr:hypothetical protein [Verrucomicrobiota bacterium]OJU98044.1 MAG: hypothetical protein BGO12_21365 [Verrucomicrobia bacterium 61-8]